MGEGEGEEAQAVPQYRDFYFFWLFFMFRQGGRCVAGSVTLQQGVPAGGRRRGRSRAGDTTPSSEPSAPSIYVGPFDGRFLHLIHLPLLTPRHVTSDDDTRDIRNDVEFQAIYVWCSPLCAGKQQRAQFRTTSPIVSVATKSTPSAVPGGRPPQAAVRRFLACGHRAPLCCTGSRLSHVVGAGGVVLQPNFSFDPPPHHTILHRRCN